jgi:hypothetical protein
MNRIAIEGRQLKVVHYTGPLWRADYNYIQPGINARTNYAGARYKYFTLSKDELGSYTRRGMRNIKQWQPRRALVLVDMMDAATRRSMAELVGTQHINIAFPTNSTGRPYRVSEEDTAVHDDAFLEQLCRLGLDGYYMERQEARAGVQPFHSEVGLCASTFGSLELVAVEKAAAAPAMPARGITKKRRYNNNNNKNNNNAGPPSIKRGRFTLNALTPTKKFGSLAFN